MMRVRGWCEKETEMKRSCKWVDEEETEDDDDDEDEKEEDLGILVFCSSKSI